MLFIEPTNEEIKRGLDSWMWLDLAGKEPILVTAFGDVFLKDDAGIWFLDSIEGSISVVAETEKELKNLLDTEEGRDTYLLEGFVERAMAEGNGLSRSQCYSFKIHPVVGGSQEYDNIEITDFVVSLNICGQIHEQVKDLPPGTNISGFTFSEETASPKKPWWKLW